MFGLVSERNKPSADASVVTMSRSPAILHYVTHNEVELS
jgi:hypothetical protein